MQLRRFRAGLVLCLALIACSSVCAGPIPTGKPAAYPNWWFLRDVIPASSGASTPTWPASYPVADDFAGANLGQVKALALAAAFEMDARLSGGAGSDVTNLISAWWQPGAAGVLRDDFAAVNAGQLKTVAVPFYTRLGLAYPWTTSASDDDNYAMVNLGQLKHVFSFSIVPVGDADADGLLDAWEADSNNFGNLAQVGSGNLDGDALSNRAESLVGSDPNIDADDDAVAFAALVLVVYSP